MNGPARKDLTNSSAFWSKPPLISHFINALVPVSCCTYFFRFRFIMSIDAQAADGFSNDFEPVRQPNPQAPSSWLQ